METGRTWRLDHGRCRLSRAPPQQATIVGIDHRAATARDQARVRVCGNHGIEVSRWQFIAIDIVAPQQDSCAAGISRCEQRVDFTAFARQPCRPRDAVGGVDDMTPEQLPRYIGEAYPGALIASAARDHDTVADGDQGVGVQISSRGQGQGQRILLHASSVDHQHAIAAVAHEGAAVGGRCQGITTRILEGGQLQRTGSEHRAEVGVIAQQAAVRQHRRRTVAGRHCGGADACRDSEAGFGKRSFRALAPVASGQMQCSAGADHPVLTGPWSVQQGMGTAEHWPRRRRPMRNELLRGILGKNVQRQRPQEQKSNSSHRPPWQICILLHYDAGLVCSTQSEVALALHCHRRRRCKLCPDQGGTCMVPTCGCHRLPRTGLGLGFALGRKWDPSAGFGMVCRCFSRRAPLPVFRVNQGLLRRIGLWPEARRFMFAACVKGTAYAQTLVARAAAGALQCQRNRHSRRR